MTRLVYIIPANRWSGVERYVLDLCRHFSSLGWPIDLFTRDARAVDSAFRFPGVTLHHAPLGGWYDFSSLIAIWRFMRRLPDNQPVVFHVNRYRDAVLVDLARRLARRPNVRLVATRHYVAPGKVRFPFSRLYHRIDAHLFVSEKARKAFLAAWIPGQTPFDPASLKVIHNSLLLPPGHLPAPFPEKGPVIAMFHGRLAPGKGLELLIDAMAVIAARKTKLRLRIVGTGNPDYVDSLRRRAVRLGVMERIDWTRHTPDPIPLIASCAFGVLPSQASEAFGLANIEYMAQGRPQVTTGNGAQPEYLTDGKEAFIVPTNNAEALADAMQRLAENPQLRLSMGMNAWNTFSAKISWSNFAPRMQSIYTFEERALNEPQASSSLPRSGR